MAQPKIKAAAIDIGPGTDKVLTTDGSGILSLPANGLNVGTDQLILGGGPGAYYIRTAYDINVFGALQLGNAQQNAIYKGGTDFFIARNYTQDYTIWQVWAPPETTLNTDEREATLALVREDNSGNAEFIDLYNNGYILGLEQQFGIRCQKRGTGVYRPFVFDWFDGTNPKIESFRVTDVDVTFTAPSEFLVRSTHAGAYTPSLLPTFSATPTFNAALSNVFEPAALTGNVTSITMSNEVGGQTVQIRFQQDATGGRIVTPPVDSKIDGTPNTDPNRVNWLIMTYSARASRWEGNWLVVPA